MSIHTRKVIIGLVFILFSLQIPVLAQDTTKPKLKKAVVAGIITDASTGEALPGANVYIANSVYGTSAIQGGTYTIFNIPPGKYKLIISFVGYEIVQRQMRITEPELYRLDFKLKPDVDFQKELTVAGEAKKDWKKHFKKFKEAFIGKTANSSKCKILNPEVLEFEYDNFSEALKVLAKDRLRIENKALGFMLDVDLINYEISTGNTKMHFIPHFSEIEPKNDKEQKKWMDKREKAYRGSLRHFLSALAKGNLKKEGFDIAGVSDMSGDRITPYGINLKKFVQVGSFSNERKIEFDDYVLVVYNREKEDKKYMRYREKNNTGNSSSNLMVAQTKQPKKFQASYLELVSNRTEFTEEGIISDQFSVRTHGYLAWERAAELLPVEYNPTSKLVEADMEVDPDAAGIANLTPRFDSYEEQYIYDLDRVEREEFLDKFESPLKLVMEESRIKEYDSLVNLALKKKYIKDYLKEKDKNPILPDNFWLVEFLRRVDYSREHFAQKSSPYYDDRGVIYIKHGSPDHKYVDPGGRKNLELYSRKQDVANYHFGKRSRDFMVKGNQTWFYTIDGREIAFHFMNTGKWKLIDSLSDVFSHQNIQTSTFQWMELVKDREAESADYAFAAMEIRKFEAMFDNAEAIKLEGKPNTITHIEMPEMAWLKQQEMRPLALMEQGKDKREIEEKTENSLIKPKLDTMYDNSNHIDFRYDIAQFKNKNGDTRVDISLIYPRDNIVELWDKKTPGDSLRVDYTYLVRDEKYDEHSKSEFGDVFALEDFDSKTFPNVIMSFAYVQEPMMGDITLQIRDDRSNKLGFKNEKISFRDYTGDSLMISDMQFYIDTESKELYKNLPSKSINGRNLCQYPYMTILKNDPVNLYFELYNMFSIGLNETFNLVVNIVENNEDDNALSKIGKFITRSKKVEMGIDFTRSVTENDLKELLEIDISELKAGKYDFEIVVKDNTGKKIYTGPKKLIEIVEKREGK